MNFLIDILGIGVVVLQKEANNKFLFMIGGCRENAKYS